MTARRGEDYNRFSGDLLDNGVRNRLNNSFAAVGFNESRIKSKYHGHHRAAAAPLLERVLIPDGLQLRRVEGYAGSAMIVEQPELDYGYASFDIPHKFKFNFICRDPISPVQRDPERAFSAVGS